MEGDGKRERRKNENKTDFEAAFEGQSALGVGITEGMCNWRPVFRSLTCSVKEKIVRHGRRNWSMAPLRVLP